jgi:hypothetical protein
MPESYGAMCGRTVKTNENPYEDICEATADSRWCLFGVGELREKSLSPSIQVLFDNTQRGTGVLNAIQ